MCASVYFSFTCKFSIQHKMSSARSKRSKAPAKVASSLSKSTKNYCDLSDNKRKRTEDTTDVTKKLRLSNTPSSPPKKVTDHEWLNSNSGKFMELKKIELFEALHEIAQKVTSKFQNNSETKEEFPDAPDFLMKFFQLHVEPAVEFLVLTNRWFSVKLSSKLKDEHLEYMHYLSPRQVSFRYAMIMEYRKNVTEWLTCVGDFQNCALMYIDPLLLWRRHADDKDEKEQKEEDEEDEE